MDKAIRTFGRAVLGKKSFDQLSPARWAQVEANNIRAEYLSESFDPLTEADVGTIETPTCLVSGADSPRLWAMLADHLHDLLPDSQRIDIPNASHIVHEDNPAVLNQHVLEFLTTVG